MGRRVALRPFASLLPTCTQQVRHLKPQEVSNVRWATAKLGLMRGHAEDPEEAAVIPLATYFFNAVARLPRENFAWWDNCFPQALPCLDGGGILGLGPARGARRDNDVFRAGE